MSFPDNKLVITSVPENCSRIILRKTVIGMAIINPGIPHKNPQNISITKTAITLIEKDLPMNTGSNIAPNSTCTPDMVMIKKSNVPVALNSTKAIIDNSMTVMKDPTI